MRFILYQGSNICTCRIYFRSNPSDPAREINTTLTFSPFTLLKSVDAFISFRLSGDRPLSPVIITYLAEVNGSVPFLVLNETASIFSAGVFKRERTFPARVKPSSSKAMAIGNKPPSMYCEYTNMTPVDFIIQSQILLIFALYFPINLGEKMFPYSADLYSKSYLPGGDVEVVYFIRRFNPPEPTNSIVS